MDEKSTSTGYENPTDGRLPRAVPLFSVAPAGPRDQELFFHLNTLLTEARAGRLRGLAFTAFVDSRNAEGELEVVAEWAVADDRPTAVYEMLGALEALKAEFTLDQIEGLRPDARA